MAAGRSSCEKRFNAPFDGPNSPFGATTLFKIILRQKPSSQLGKGVFNGNDTLAVDGHEICSTEIGKNLRGTWRQKVHVNRFTSREAQVDTCKRKKTLGWVDRSKKRDTSNLVLDFFSKNIRIRKETPTLKDVLNLPAVREKELFRRLLDLPNTRLLRRFLEHFGRSHVLSSRCTLRSATRAQRTVVSVPLKCVNVAQAHGLKSGPSGREHHYKHWNVDRNKHLSDGWIGFTRCEIPWKRHRNTSKPDLMLSEWTTMSTNTKEQQYKNGKKKHSK